MSSWLRVNRLYLVALAVLVPAALLVALSTDWWRYVEAENGEPIVVSGSQTVEYAGSQFSLLEWHSFSSQTNAGQEASLIPGTSLVSATIGIRPGELAPFCSFELRDTAGARSWPEADFTDVDYEIADDVENYCDSSATEPYRVQVYFVVPDEAATQPQLRLSVNDAYPAFLLFEL